MNSIAFLPLKIIVVIFFGISHAFEAIKNDVRDLRTSTFVSATRKDDYWQDEQLFVNGLQTDLSPNSKCRKDLEYIIAELQNVTKGQTISDWTLDFLDSIGKIPSNIGQGNIFWFGDHNLCQSVNVKERNFRGQYCISFWHQPSNPIHLQSYFGQSGLRLGLCFPDSCTNKDDLNASLVLYKKILDFLPGSRALHEVTKNFKSIECKTSTQWTFSGHFCILCILILVVVTILATVKDRVFRTDCNLNQSQDGENKTKPSVWVTCFSLDTSLKAFKWTESRGENMDCLSGLRFCCTIYIVSLHIFAYASMVVGNSLAMPDSGQNLFAYNQITGLGSDTFFLLSGFLMAFQFFQGVKYGQRFNLVHFCFKRYLRLIAPVVFAIWFHATIFPHLGSGPFWDNGDGHNSEVVKCQKTWWRTVLGLQNLYPLLTQCQAWTWQSSADLQMSILSPVYLLTLKRSPRLGMLLIVFSTVFSVWITGVSTWRTYNVGNFDYLPSIDFLQTAYIATWCRLGSYLIGIISGYYLATDNITISPTSKSTVNSITLISALLCVTMFLGPMLPLELSTAVAFYSVQKVLWSIGLASLLILSISGHLPTFNRCMSWKPFVQLSQISYSVNILHVLVYYYYLNQVSTPITLTLMSTLVMLIGLLPGIFAIAFLYFVLWESPIIQLGKILFSKSFHKKIQ